MNSSIWISVLVSLITSSVAALFIQRQLYNSEVRRRREAVLASVMGELNQAKAILTYNAQQKSIRYPAFLRVPVDNLRVAAYTESHLFSPSLVGKWAVCSTGLMHLNRLMSIHDELWFATGLKDETEQSKEAQREELRFRIGDVCGGNKSVEGIGVVEVLYLPNYIDFVLSQTEEALRSSGSSFKIQSIMYDALRPRSK